eukprot:Nk52_evm13s675 gene=Nk52_evmTU13s675
MTVVNGDSKTSSLCNTNNEGLREGQDRGAMYPSHSLATERDVVNVGSAEESANTPEEPLISGGEESRPTEVDIMIDPAQPVLVLDKEPAQVSMDQGKGGNNRKQKQRLSHGNTCRNGSEEELVSSVGSTSTARSSSVPTVFVPHGSSDAALKGNGDRYKSNSMERKFMKKSPYVNQKKPLETVTGYCSACAGCLCGCCAFLFCMQSS